MKSTVTYLDSRLRILDPGPRTPDSGLWTLDRNVRIRTLFVMFLRKALCSHPVPLHSGELMATCELSGKTEEMWGRGGGAPRINWHPIQGEWQYVLSFHDTETVKSSGCNGATRVFKLNPKLNHRVTHLTISCCSQLVRKCVQWKAILCKRQSCLLIEKIKIF